MKKRFWCHRFSKVMCTVFFKILTNENLQYLKETNKNAFVEFSKKRDLKNY